MSRLAQPLKIVMVNIGFLPHSVGGTEVYTYNLAKELIGLGHNVTVFTARNDLSFSQYEIIEETYEGIPVFSVVNSPFFSRSYLDYFINSQIDQIFEGFLQAEKPDLVHFQHMAYLSGNLHEIAHNCGIPSVSTIHDYWYLCFRSQLIRPDGTICSGPRSGFNCSTCDNGVAPNPTAVPRYPELVQFINTPSIKDRIEKVLSYMPTEMINVARSVLFKSLNGGKNVLSNPSLETLLQNQLRVAHFKRQFDFPSLIISPSHHLKNRYEKEGYQNIEVLPLGFHPVTHVTPKPFEGTLQLAFIGNLARHKGLHIVLQELLPLAEAGANFKINIYGHTDDSVYLNHIKALANQFPADYLVFHGRYNADKDLRNIFSNTHFALFPSTWEENHPLVIREALLHGIPVIASNLGGTGEVINHGKNGYLFDPLTKNDLQQTIQQILAEPEQIEKLTAGAMSTEIESMQAHVSKIASAYQQIIQADLPMANGSSDFDRHLLSGTFKAQFLSGTTI